MANVNYHKAKEPLNSLNYLNLLGYIINMVVVSGAGTWFAKQLKSIEEVSVDYQSLLNPAGWAFSIWSIIFLSQGIFSICQLFPSYRSHPLVQNGIGIWFFIACISQSLWVFAFLSDEIDASMVAMLGILISLIIIVVSQQYETSPAPHLGIQRRQYTNGEFWLLRFPFEIHCGWIIVATILNANIVLVARNASVEIQLAATMLSLGLVLMVTTIVLFVTKKGPRYTIPFVLAWAMFATNYGMQSSKESIILAFGQTVITSVQYTSIALYQFILALIFARFMSFYFCIEVDSPENDSSNIENDLLLNEEVPLQSAAF